MKIKAIILFLVVSLLATIVPFNAFASEQPANAKVPWTGFTQGTGTTADPYIIKTPEDLNQVRNYPSKCFKLGNDIDLGVYPFNTGNGWDPIDNFKGVFDGNGHSIKNLFINRPSEYDCGLFGLIQFDSCGQVTIKNFCLFNVNITGFDNVGGVLGQVTKPTISRVQETIVYFSNIHVYGTVKAVSDSVGAILGKLDYYWDYLAYDMYRCSAQAKIYAGPDAIKCGGLVGCSMNATIRSKMQECFFIGHLYNAKQGGGLIGRGYASEVVKNCYANVTFHNFKEKVSGIMGSGWVNAIGEIGIEVDRCYSVMRLDNCGGATAVPYVATPPVNSEYWKGTNPKYPIRVTNCFYDKSVLPGYDYQGGKTTEELALQSNFTDWDFENTWSIDLESSYAQLRNVFTPINEVEDNDTIENANTVVEDILVKASVYKEGDVDFYMFTPAESDVYTFESIGSTDVCGELYGLYVSDDNKTDNDANNAVKPLFYSLNDNKSAVDKNFKITFNLIKDKKYYLKVKHANKSGTGDYRLRISRWIPITDSDDSNYSKSSQLVNIPSDPNYLQKDIYVENKIDTVGGECWYKLKPGESGTIFFILDIFNISEQIADQTLYKDLDIELYEEYNGKLRLLEYSSAYTYNYEYIYYPVTDLQTNHDLYIRVRNNSQKPGLMPETKFGLADPPYGFNLSFTITKGFESNGGEYAGWKAYWPSDSLKQDNPLILGFSKEENTNYPTSENIYDAYFDNEHTIKYTDLIKYAISIWNDAQWRYQLSDVNLNEFKKDATLALDETGEIPNHIRDFSLYYDNSSSTIARSDGSINTRWFNKDSLKNEKLTKIEGKIGIDNSPDIEDLAKRIFVHEMGHMLGLADLYGSPKVLQNSNIDNRDKVMFGVSGYWNISQINKYDYPSYLTLKDTEGLCRVNGVWKQQPQNVISASYVEVTEEELYKDSDIILKGKVKEVSDSKTLPGYSEIVLDVESYYKDNNSKLGKEVKVLQEGNSSLQYSGDPLLAIGEEVILFLQENSTGNLVIMGGPQGRFDITSSSDSKTFVENYLTKAVRESIQEERKLINKELNLNIPEIILPDTDLDSFVTVIKDAIQQYSEGSSITGYLSPDINDIRGQSTLKSGFKIEILGTEISTLSQADGSFKLSNVPADIADFTVRISKEGYLYRDIKCSKVNSPSTEIGTIDSPVVLWAGDLNQDNTINIADIIEVAKEFNTGSINENFKYKFDLNQDNWINMSDFIIIARNFNKVTGDYLPIIL